MPARRNKEGTYHVVNESKYRGSMNGGGARAAQYRSSWELRLMGWLDSNPNVVEWGSERIVVQYRDPVDNGIHRYFIDFDFVVKDSGGKMKKFFAEVKPDDQTRPPEQPKRMTEKGKINFMMKLRTFAKNQAKWEAAKKYASKVGATFMIITEKNCSFFNSK